MGKLSSLIHFPDFYVENEADIVWTEQSKQTKPRGGFVIVSLMFYFGQRGSLNVLILDTNERKNGKGRKGKERRNGGEGAH